MDNEQVARVLSGWIKDTYGLDVMNLTPDWYDAFEELVGRLDEIGHYITEESYE